MKRILVIMAIVNSISVVNAQNQYRFWFKRDGVEVYSWYYNSKYDAHVSVKIINMNDYDVNISWDHFVWQYGFAPVQQYPGQSDFFKARQAKSGKESGLLWYPPKEYQINNLNSHFLNFKVERTE